MCSTAVNADGIFPLHHRRTVLKKAHIDFVWAVGWSPCAGSAMDTPTGAVGFAELTSAKITVCSAVTAACDSAALITAPVPTIAHKLQNMRAVLRSKRQILHPRRSANRLDYNKKPGIENKYPEPSQAEKPGPKLRNKALNSKGVYNHCATLSPIRKTSTCENKQLHSEESDTAELFSLEGIG